MIVNNGDLVFFFSFLSFLLVVAFSFFFGLLCGYG